MVQAASASKNIWVAASDGDLDRVRHLIETENLSPNIPDPNSYTPMHAAASYAHTDLLEYLISKGGDINLRDDDGDTPLYVVESVEMARWMIERGADWGVVNEEGMSPAQALEDEHPQISTYLHSLDPNSTSTTRPTTLTHGSTSTEEGPISALAVETYTSHQTTNLLEETKRIMEASERDGTDPDEQLREVVERAVREGFNFGGALGGVAAAASGVEVDGDDEGRKRARDMDGNGNGV